MIAKDDMMGVLLASCPSFGLTWREFLSDWQDEPGDPPLYVALSDFARHLIGMLERGETSELPSIFAAIEKLHVDGNQYVKEAATIGILESLQNTNLHSHTNPEQFQSFLGPESARSWNELQRFWNGLATGEPPSDQIIPGN